MKRRSCLWALCGLMIVACGDGGDHAGTSTETTNGVAGLVRTGSTPLPSARIVLLKTENSDTAYIDTADSQGRFSIDADSGIYNLLVESKDTSGIAWRYGVRTGRDTALDVGVVAPASWIVSGLNSSDSVCLLATPFCAKANANGVAKLQRLPEGSFTLLRNQVPIASGSLHPNSMLSTVASQIEGFVLEDFEDGDSYNLLYPWSGGDGWYLKTLRSTQMVFPDDTIPFQTALVTEGAYRGRSLLVRYIDTAAVPQQASMQVGLALASEGLDLSTLDSVCFFARGSGMVRIALESNDGNDTTHYKSIWDISLFAGWREFCLETSYPKYDEGYPYHVPYKLIGNNIRWLTFFLSKVNDFESPEFALDQVRLMGVKARDFYIAPR